ncbi:MAG: ECF transporter S component [Oscillospiraceae bacterium]|nr:ECF transporter S component [Oscillospiraceae bacterium]
MFKTKRLIASALSAALCCVASLLQISSPAGGYFNAGDAVVLLSAFLMGPVSGAAAAGIGSAAADVLSGFVIYAPATLIIKALMALVSGAVLRRLKSPKRVAPAVLAGIAAEAVMISGYFAFASVILGLGAGALADVPGNLIQGFFGVAAGTYLYLALSKIPGIRDFADL